ncbi:hypothetical protein FZEAL_8203 [Fusarium zealandicum]|uniref:F-box domain-containing protein n=1 Tax=Fusarium zealandicum TaxID=1053134 RepID=A0A8H4UEG6_9HYPO|nr:hypothetical protein FZEAL_8203 [Fusarium zealandicum]
MGQLLKTRETWVKEFRSVYTENDDWHGIKLSGIGTFTDFRPYAPEDTQKRYREDGLDEDYTVDVSVHVLSLKAIINPMPHCDPAPYWGFGFHAACWKLLTTLIEPNLTDLFYICFSMRVDVNGILDWGHEYGGAAYTHHVPWGIPQLKRCAWFESPSEGFSCNPYDIPAIRSFLNLSVSLGDGRDSIPVLSDRIKMDGDNFKLLPPEILQDIVIRLSSEDVVHLRQSSPTFANLGLSEIFWASRFKRGHEYHHIFESSKSRPISWRSLYLSMRFLAPVFPALVNRKRVWNLALHLESLLSQVSGISCQGHRLKSYYEPDGDHDSLTWHTAKRGIRGPTDAFTVGCRPLRTRVVRLPTGLQVRDLWVSFVRMSSGSFISGLRFVGEDEESTSLGYIHHDHEIRVRFPSHHYQTPYIISGWHLAIDLQGFRALAVLDGHGTLSYWAGEAGEIPKWCLTGPGQTVSAIKAEFDALKLVSLGRDVNPDTKFDHGLLWRNSCLWSPDIPPDHIHFNGTDDDFPFKAFQNLPVPFSTIMFGGPHGELLCQLIEIVVYIWDVSKFTGFEFVYVDPSKNQHIGDLGPYPESMTRVHTPSDDFRLSMPIDGPGGERIQDVEVQAGGGGIYGLKIRTTRGTEMLFPPPPDFKDFALTSLQSPGQTITGFYMNNKFPLERFGLMSIRTEEESETG